MQRQSTLHAKSPRQRQATHLESAHALHRGAAASLLEQSELHGGFRCKSTALLLDQSELHGGFRCKGKALCTQSVPGRDKPRSLSLRTPHTVEQPQACSISRSFMAASVAKANHLQVHVHGPHGRHSPQAETSTPLRPPASRTVEQPQACSVSRIFMAASVAKPNHLQCTWSQQPSARSRHEHAPWSPPPPRTVEQPQLARSV